MASLPYRSPSFVVLVLDLPAGTRLKRDNGYSNDRLAKFKYGSVLLVLLVLPADAKEVLPLFGEEGEGRKRDGRPVEYMIPPIGRGVRGKRGSESTPAKVRRSQVKVTS
jgi:hypothetical protein